MQKIDAGLAITIALTETMANKNAVIGILAGLQDVPGFNMSAMQEYLKEVRDADVTGVDQQAYKSAMNLFLQATEPTEG